MAARQLSVDYGLISVVLVFAIGHRLAGWWGATTAALIWSLDPRAVGLSTQVILDGPMVMFSFAAVLAYLDVHPALAPAASPRRRMIGLAIAGAFGALSALTKVVGVTILIAIVVDLAWRRLTPRAEPRVPMAPLFGGLLLGVAGVSAIALLPFVIAAPAELLRQAVFFQLLRPPTEMALIDRMRTLVDRPQQLPILVLAGLGLIAYAITKALSIVFAIRRRRDDGHHFAAPVATGWRVVLLWAAANALVFATTRKVEPHYQLHLLAALALVAAGVGLIPLWLERVPRLSAPIRRWAVPALILVLVAVTVQQAPSWFRTAGASDPKYLGVSRYLREVVPPGARVLLLDARVAFIAGREPSRAATGYLVDPYGHLAYLGLDLGDSGPAELFLAVIGGEKHDWNSVVASPRVKSDLLARFRTADLVVVHGGELWRLGPAANALDALADQVTEVRSYMLYVMHP